MTVPNRHDPGNSYRYGFQGQEKDDELKGEGNALNYTYKMHDPRVGRFLSLDPLSKNFPFLTPYQFASNNPIANNDIEGLEGISYRVVKFDETTGKAIPIKRVIEIDLHVATNVAGTCGAYKPEEIQVILAKNNQVYNKKSYKDDENLPVEFKFNYIEFNPENIDGRLYAENLMSQTICTKNNIEDNVPFDTRKGVAIWKEDLKGSAEGQQSGTKIIIDVKGSGMYENGHRESHEIGHFLLMAEGHTLETALEGDDHTYGGFMKYGVIENIVDEGTIIESNLIVKPQYKLT
jgi:RHS repeat-associated protein